MFSPRIIIFANNVPKKVCIFGKILSHLRIYVSHRYVLALGIYFCSVFSYLFLFHLYHTIQQCLLVTASLLVENTSIKELNSFLTNFSQCIFP
jgi:hypothetical protein